MNPLELVKFVESQIAEPRQQLNMLALLGDPPGEDFQPTMKLPQTNELPALRLGDNGLGSTLANLDYGIAAPVPGEVSAGGQSIGELLTGELG